MAIDLQTLLDYTNSLLDINAFQDYCPNGLQVEGNATVSRIVTGVTACEALIDRAIEQKADAILVHHGYFWKGESQPVTGMKQRRIRKLLENNISLLAYHLPLDAHPELGNNRQLADLLGFSITAGLDDSKYPVGFVGKPASSQTASGLEKHIGEVLGRKPLLVGDPRKPVEIVAWCTGAAQSYIEKAKSQGADCFISGEISEPTVHFAREMDITYIAAGHHATERYGAKALGEHLAEHFKLDVQFIDIDNPV